MRKSRVLHATALMSVALVLQGCALALPLATTAAVTAVGNHAADRTTDQAVRGTQMNCAQLRAEYARLQKDVLAQANPLSGWAGHRAAVKSMAAQRRCRL